MRGRSRKRSSCSAKGHRKRWKNGVLFTRTGLTAGAAAAADAAAGGCTRAPVPEPAAQDTRTYIAERQAAGDARRMRDSFSLSLVRSSSPSPRSQSLRAVFFLLPHNFSTPFPQFAAHVRSLTSSCSPRKNSLKYLFPVHTKCVSYGKKGNSVQSGKKLFWVDFAPVFFAVSPCLPSQLRSFAASHPRRRRRSHCSLIYLRV